VWNGRGGERIKQLDHPNMKVYKRLVDDDYLRALHIHNPATGTQTMTSSHVAADAALVRDERDEDERQEIPVQQQQRQQQQRQQPRKQQLRQTKSFKRPISAQSKGQAVALPLRPASAHARFGSNNTDSRKKNHNMALAVAQSLGFDYLSSTDEEEGEMPTTTKRKPEKKNTANEGERAK